jgi:hypothetical protein
VRRAGTWPPPGAEQIPLAVHVNELFDLLIGVLTAEVSEQTRSALSKAP